MKSAVSVAPALACVLLTAGCGGRPPATFVGESQHFRLYVDPDLMPVPAAFAGENALAALETNWADFATMLQMPDGKVTYYWYRQDHVSDACNGAHVGGCTKEDEMEIVAPTLPDPHELIHAYTYLRLPRRPTPFLAEGIAEAISCGNDAPIGTLLGGDWRAAVAAVDSDDVYGKGGLFVRQMIRRYGIDAFLRYYEQSPERRDPALFAANFESFWGESIDDVWTAINTVELAVPFIDQKICPCSLPAITPSDSTAIDAARTPYWTVPDLGDDTLALTAARYQQVSVRSCAGDVEALTGKGILARLGSGGGWYAVGPVASAGIGRFVAETCAAAAHYTLSPDVLVGNPHVAVAVPAPTSSSTMFVAFDVPFPNDMKVWGADTICDSCAFDEGTCTPPFGAVATLVAGNFYARLQIDSGEAERRFGIAAKSLSFYR